MVKVSSIELKYPSQDFEEIKTDLNRIAEQLRKKNKDYIVGIKLIFEFAKLEVIEKDEVKT